MNNAPCDDSAFDAIDACMHCGLCIETCPTYRATGIESDSPRGRLLLMRAAHEERLSIEEIQPALDRCVQCHACESSCPSNVDYSGLLQQNLKQKSSLIARVMSSRTLSNFAGIGLRMLSLLAVHRWLRKMPRSKIGRALMLTPDKVTPFSKSQQVYPALGDFRAKVALQLGCVERQANGDVINDLIAVFTHQGFELHFIEQENCCGALHYHSSDTSGGTDMAMSSATTFAHFDYVVSLSAGCSSHLQQHSGSNIFYDPLIFLAEQGLRGNLKPIEKEIAWVVPCHLKHLQHNWQAVGELLLSIPGLKLLDFTDKDLCCGAGGASMINNHQLSASMGDAKARCLEASEATHVLSSNSGCRMQIDAHLRFMASEKRTEHPLRLLSFSLGIDEHIKSRQDCKTD